MKIALGIILGAITVVVIAVIYVLRAFGPR